jgi:hypothetical protein
MTKENSFAKITILNEGIAAFGFLISSFEISLGMPIGRASQRFSH